MKYFLILLALAQVVTFQAQTYSLPSLKYQYTDYEPDIDALTMQIHHSKHHNQTQSRQMYHHPHLRTQWQHQYAMDDRKSTGAIGSTIA